ncbi:MAG: GGDEF domain-containing protein [Candidatus Paceibacterota bacterium]|jgi:GGDEF domain-containing protein
MSEASQEQIENHEKSADLVANKQEIKESIIEASFQSLKEAKDKEEKDGEQNFPKIIEQLPKDLRFDVQEKFERFKSYGLSEKQLIFELKKEIRDIKTAYEDKRFEIPNGSYLRYEIAHLVDTLVNEKVNLTKIRGLGIINFDVNGLKAVNDIAGHEQGTEYLRRIVQVFKVGHTTKDLEDNGVKVFVSSNGGDEFAIILSDDVNLTEVRNGQIFINKILRYYQEEVSSIDMSDLVDFSNPEIAKKFEGIEIPNNFKFTASISGGTALLEEIFTDDKILPEIENEDLDYSDKLGKIISALFEKSDTRGRNDKETFKKELGTSNDRDKEFLLALLKRNAETALIEKENRELKKKLANCN